MYKHQDGIIPKENGRYLIAVAWWQDDVKATYKNGKFVPDGFENDLQRHFDSEYVTILGVLWKDETCCSASNSQ